MTLKKPPTNNKKKKQAGISVQWMIGGRNSSVGSAWARCHSVAGSILLWGHFPVEGIFPLELTWVQTPFPQNSFGWEYKPRSSLCTHAFHRTDSKDPDVHVLDGWMPATKKHTQHAPSTKTECDYLNAWIKKWSHTQKSHPKVVNPRDIAGERKKKKKKKKKKNDRGNSRSLAWLVFRHNKHETSAHRSEFTSCWWAQ